MELVDGAGSAATSDLRGEVAVRAAPGPTSPGHAGFTRIGLMYAVEVADLVFGDSTNAIGGGRWAGRLLLLSAKTQSLEASSEPGRGLPRLSWFAFFLFRW